MFGLGMENQLFNIISHNLIIVSAKNIQDLIEAINMINYQKAQLAEYDLTDEQKKSEDGDLWETPTSTGKCRPDTITLDVRKVSDY